jgi:hypothetical protein
MTKIGWRAFVNATILESNKSLIGLLELPFFSLAWVVPVLGLVRVL